MISINIGPDLLKSSLTTVYDLFVTMMLAVFGLFYNSFFGK